MCALLPRSRASLPRRVHLGRQHWSPVQRFGRYGCLRALPELTWFVLQSRRDSSRDAGSNGNRYGDVGRPEKSPIEKAKLFLHFCSFVHFLFLDRRLKFRLSLGLMRWQLREL